MMNMAQIQAMARSQAQKVVTEVDAGTGANIATAGTSTVDILEPLTDTGGFLEVTCVFMNETGAVEIAKKIASFKNLSGVISVATSVLLASAGLVADFTIVNNSGKVAVQVTSVVNNVNYKFSYSTGNLDKPAVALP